MVARAKLSYQRQSVSAEQSRGRLTQPRQPFHRSLSENVTHSPTSEITEEEAFGQKLNVEAEIEVIMA